MKRGVCGSARVLYSHRRSSHIMSTNTSSRRAYRTPDAAASALRPENVKTRVRQQQRLGDLEKRIPLSPSKHGSPIAPTTGSKVDLDGLADDLDALAVSASPTKNKHPLAGATTATTVSAPNEEQGKSLPPVRGTRLKSLSSAAGPPAIVASKKLASTLASSSTSTSSASSDKSASSKRPYKPIDDYTSPIQLLTRDPDWEALAPQAQHGMLGLHGDLPMNLTGTVGVGGDEWGARKTVVSESTMKQARDISRNNVAGSGTANSTNSNPSGAAVLEEGGKEGTDGDKGEDGGVS